MFRFQLPDIGEGVVEAEILEWKVRVGDRVELDQVLVELMTDKAEMEIPSPRAGRVHRLHFQVGEVAPVGAVLIEIDDAENAAAAAPPEPPPPAPRPAAAPASDAATAEAAARPAEASHPPRQPERPRSRQKASAPRRARDGDPVRAVPAVRELARRLAVELSQVQGTGPGGRIMKRDVEVFHGAREVAAEPAPVPAASELPDEDDWERTPLRGLRRAIARRMVRARRSAAHFTYVEEVDVTDLLAKLEAGPLEALSPLAFLAHAVVRTLPDFPDLNASIDDEREEIVHKRKVHLGVAAATDGGLVVPVIRDAAGLSVRSLAEAIADLAGRAREGSLLPAELRGSTFTITSLGKLGGIVSTPIVNHPEVAILGVSRIREEPRVRAGEIVVRRVMNLSLSVDHRITDGLVAARFVEALRGILENVRFAEFGEGRERA